MKSIIRFSVQNSYVVIFLTLLVSIIGIYCFQNMAIDAVPDTTNTQVQVITLPTGLVPEEVERQVTFPIETSLNGIKGVEEIRSISRAGLSHITVIFTEGTDILEARQLISERLLIVKDELPQYQSFMGPIVTGLGDIFHYVVIPKNRGLKDLTMEELMELRNVQDWVIRPKLRRVKGIAEVNTTGGYPTQYYVQPHLKKMHEHSISFNELNRALERNNFNVGGSYFEKGDSAILIQGLGLLKNIEDIKNVPIKMSKNLQPIFIKDIAEVKLDKPLVNGSSSFNGDEAVIGSPLMLAGENSRVVAVALNEAIDDLNENILKDYEIKVLYDRSQLVNATLSTVSGNLIFGCGLVVLVLIFLIGNLRAAIITSVMIPVSLLITFIIMKVTNLSGNLMSLGALDFGVIIDGAVIVIDNCIRQIQGRTNKKGKELDREEIKETVVDATHEIISSSMLGRFIIILVFIPLLLLTGVEGKMFSPMAKTFVYALGALFILSFTSVPALASLLLKSEKEEKKPIMLRLFERIYYPALNWSLNKFWFLATISASLLAVSFYLFSNIGGEFIPKMDEGSAAVRVVRKADVGPTHVLEEQKRLERLLLDKIPEIATAFSRSGTAEVPDDPNGINMSDIMIEFKDKSEWRPDITRADIRHEILETLKSDARGASFMMGQPIEMRSNELLEGTRADISLKVFGNDLDQIVALSEKIQTVVESVQGASEVELDVQGKSMLLKVTPNEEVREQIAVGRGNILDTVEMALAGIEVGKIYEGMRSYPLVLRLEQEDRSNIESIENLPIFVRDGLSLKLKDIAHIEQVPTHSVITRENTQRRVAVQINVKGRDMESYVREAAALVEKEVELPHGVRLEWGGNFKNLQNAKARLGVIIPITLFVVFLLIYYAFFNWKIALLIFACIPFAWVGGILMLIAGGLPFSISAGVGFIALSGIAVINGMILVAYFNTLKNQGMTGEDLVKNAVSLRLRPVLMTAIADIFGFLPMAFATGLGAEVQKPLALVVIGGVITATLLTLIFIPVLYKKFEKKIGLAKIVEH